MEIKTESELVVDAKASAEAPLEFVDRDVIDSVTCDVGAIKL